MNAFQDCVYAMMVNGVGIDKYSNTVSGCNGQDESYDSDDTPNCMFDASQSWGPPKKAQVSFVSFPPNEGGTYIQNDGGKVELWSGQKVGKSQEYQALCTDFKSWANDQGYGGFAKTTYVDEEGWIYE